MWQNRDTSLSEIIFKSNLKRLFVIIVLFFIIIIIKLFYLQIIRGTYFNLISEENRIQVYNDRAPRGKIYARDSEVIVDHRPVYTAILSKSDIDLKTLQETISKLSKFLQIDIPALSKKIQRLKSKSFEMVYIAKDIPREMMFELEENAPYLPGIMIITEPIRRYRFSKLSSQVFGYLDEINSRELKQLKIEGYKMGDLIGKSGLEKVYDIYLKGKDGKKRIEVDAKGRQIKIISEDPPIAGNDLHLTIDFDLQKASEKLLEGKEGTIVALDPNSGAILAMASSPGFDPIQFLYPALKEQEDLLRDTRYPMMNRALQSQYAPGSIFKLITTIAALEDKKVTIDEEHNCKGYFYLGKSSGKRKGRVFKCWKWEEKGHGKLDLKGGLTHSCDVYYYKLGIKIGVERLAHFSRMYGLSMYTGIDLPSEKKGLVPDSAWKRDRLNSTWYTGDTVNMSIGQGFLLVTPIQMVNMTAAIVNGGYLYRPFIARKIVSKNGKILFENKPIILREIKISKETIDFIKECMTNVVSKGTGRAAYIKGIEIGGKTGTAENPHGEDHAWFIGAAPMRNPEIALCVFIENGGHGGSVSAPIARKLLKLYFRNN